MSDKTVPLSSHYAHAEWDKKGENAPPAELEKVWILHVRDTKSYISECMSICGHVIHQDPDSMFLPVGELERRRAHTRTAYRRIFGKRPPVDVWGAANADGTPAAAAGAGAAAAGPVPPTHNTSSMATASDAANAPEPRITSQPAARQALASIPATAPSPALAPTLDTIPLLTARQEQLASASAHHPLENQLRASLQQLRSQCAKARNIHAYTVYSNAMLDELVRARPGTLQALEQLGIDKPHIDKFGALIIQRVHDVLNGVCSPAPPAPHAPPAAPAPTPTHAHISIRTMNSAPAAAAAAALAPPRPLLTTLPKHTHQQTPPSQPPPSRTGHTAAAKNTLPAKGTPTPSPTPAPVPAAHISPASRKLFSNRLVSAVVYFGGKEAQRLTATFVPNNLVANVKLHAIARFGLAARSEHARLRQWDPLLEVPGAPCSDYDPLHSYGDNAQFFLETRQASEAFPAYSDEMMVVRVMNYDLKLQRWQVHIHFTDHRHSIPHHYHLPTHLCHFHTRYAQQLACALTCVFFAASHVSFAATRRHRAAAQVLLCAHLRHPGRASAGGAGAPAHTHAPRPHAVAAR